MTENKHIYQAMFLLDNEEVRKGFNASRDWVKTTLEKYGIEVKVLRLWGERQLAYPIGGRKRATYLLGWLEASGDAVNEVKRELYLLGPVFRCLFLHEEEIPAEELAAGIQEIKDSEVVIPEEVEEFEFEEPYEEPEKEQRLDDKSKDEKDEKDENPEDEKSEGDKESDSKSEEVKKDDN
jgi:ribosomal protein S6